MKQLTSNSTTTLATKTGTEPIIVVSIHWERGSSKFLSYADKDWLTIPGKILEVSGLEGGISTKSGNGGSVNITLDDTDGSIKEIIDTNDIHKVKVEIFQCYQTLTWADRILLFGGELSSPIEWSEGERNVRFTVVTRIEDNQVGFSPEEAQFPFLTQDAIGKPWPLAFGNVVNLPATKAGQVLSGLSEDRLDIVDWLLWYKRQQLSWAIESQVLIQAHYGQIIEQACNNVPPIDYLTKEFIRLCQLENSLLQQLSSLQGSLLRLKQLVVFYRKSGDARNYRATVNKIINTSKQIFAIAGTKQGHFTRFGHDIQIPAQLGTLTEIGNWKVWIADSLQYIKTTLKTKEEANIKLEAAIKASSKLYQELVEVDDQICWQELWIKQSIVINGGYLFPQNQVTDIMIKGLRWRGTFNYDLFTFLTPGSPLPIYGPGDVIIADAYWPIDYCNVLDEFANINKFWITDGSKNLKGMYCLVESKYFVPSAVPGVNPYRHIVHVIEQDDNLCTFELCKINTETAGHGTNGTPKLLPEDSDNPNTPVDQNNVPLLTDAMEDITGVPMSDEDAKTLANLEILRKYDTTCAPLIPGIPGPRNLYTIIGYDIGRILAVASVPLVTWIESSQIVIEEIPSSAAWSGDYGSKVYTLEDQSEVYVANILPSTIKSVMAYRTSRDGVRRLQPVPETYYKINEHEILIPANEELDEPEFAVTSLHFRAALSSLAHDNWEDNVYITLQSSVGPNVVDVIQYLIETYCQSIDGISTTIDSVSFAATKTLLSNYPVNFALLNRQNVRQVLQEIAWQARCALWDVDNKFYIKYLAIEPTSDITITEDDVEVNKLKLTMTDTEELVTEMDITWKETYLPPLPLEEPRRLVLRNNVKKYGLHKSSQDFYIYNDLPSIIKAATFWMIRMSNTWKRVTFTTFLPNLALDIYDTVTLDFVAPYFATSEMKAVVERLTFDSNDNTISIDTWLPVRTGEMTQYPFAWPSTLDPTITYPTLQEIADGDAGGNGIGILVTGPVLGQVSGPHDPGLLGGL